LLVIRTTEFCTCLNIILIGEWKEVCDGVPAVMTGEEAVLVCAIT
jgi:hypothetical protein